MKVILASLWTLCCLFPVEAATLAPGLEAIKLIAPQDASDIRVDAQPELLRSQLEFITKRSWDQSAISEQSLAKALGADWRACSGPTPNWEDFGEKQGERVVRIRQRLRYYSAKSGVLLVAERVTDDSVSANSTSPHSITVSAILQTFRNAAEMAQFLSSLSLTCDPKK